MQHVRFLIFNIAFLGMLALPMIAVLYICLVLVAFSMGLVLKSAGFGFAIWVAGMVGIGLVATWMRGPAWAIRTIVYDMLFIGFFIGPSEDDEDGDG